MKKNLTGFSGIFFFSVLERFGFDASVFSMPHPWLLSTHLFYLNQKGFLQTPKQIPYNTEDHDTIPIENDSNTLTNLHLDSKNIKLLTFIKQKFVGGSYLRIHSKNSKRILTNKTNTKRERRDTIISYDSDKSPKANYLNVDRTDLKWH